MADNCAYCKDGIIPTGQIWPFCGKKGKLRLITLKLSLSCESATVLPSRNNNLFFIGYGVPLGLTIFRALLKKECEGSGR